MSALKRVITNLNLVGFPPQKSSYSIRLYSLGLFRLGQVIHKASCIIQRLSALCICPASVKSHYYNLTFDRVAYLFKILIRVIIMSSIHNSQYQ